MVGAPLGVRHAKCQLLGCIPVQPQTVWEALTITLSGLAPQEYVQGAGTWHGGHHQKPCPESPPQVVLAAHKSCLLIKGLSGLSGCGQEDRCCCKEACAGWRIARDHALDMDYRSPDPGSRSCWKAFDLAASLLKSGCARMRHLLTPFLRAVP